MKTKDYLLTLDRTGRLVGLPKKATPYLRESLDLEAEEVQRRAKALRWQAELWEKLLQLGNPDGSPDKAPTNAPKAYHAPLRNLLDPYGSYAPRFLEALLEYPRVYDSTGAADSSKLGALCLFCKVKTGRRKVYACELTEDERLLLDHSPAGETQNAEDILQQADTDAQLAGTFLFNRAVTAFCNFLIKAERERHRAAPELATAALAVKKLAAAIEEQPYTAPSKGTPPQFSSEVKAVLSALEAAEVKLAASDYKEPAQAAAAPSLGVEAITDAAARGAAEVLRSQAAIESASSTKQRKLCRRLQAWHVYDLMKHCKKTQTEAAEKVLHQPKLSHPVTREDIAITDGYPDSEITKPSGGLGSQLKAIGKCKGNAAAYFGRH